MTALSREFQFEPQSEAARWIDEVLGRWLEHSPKLATLQQRLLKETATRLVDWVDRISLPSDAAELTRMGWEALGVTLFRPQNGTLPVVAVTSRRQALELRVDDVAAFLRCHAIETKLIGAPLAPCRKALAWSENGVETWVVERRAGKLLDDSEQPHPELVMRHWDAFRTRRRSFTDDQQGFAHARAVIDAAVDQLGSATASDLFFRAEREYWQSRNTAGALQKQRQDCLGLGWGNHDHHTYRASRECFVSLIASLEALGMRCGERFYAGAEAGWGAQVLEHPDTGALVFAEVELSPDEVLTDFAHRGLKPRAQLGTVGLWCKLHGEALLQAGMHRLEGRFDFARATRFFGRTGGITRPYTDSDHFKQCSTIGQRWPVSVSRLRTAVEQGWVSSSQAEAFLLDGAIGSHLEILERKDVFEGFDRRRTGEIIAATDPRFVAAG